MAITMQGSWTVTVKSKSAAFDQRFVIAGATAGNVSHAGVPGNSAFVTGAQWSINIQSQAPGQPWIDSKQRITFPTVSAGLVQFDIRSDDTGNDGDYNDLVLTCSMPISASEFIIYGNAKTYAGLCRWNPCIPFYYVIESRASLQVALQSPDLRRIIETLYPDRVPRRPGPGPDPGPEKFFRPLVIPTGAPAESRGLVFRSTLAQAPQPDAPIKQEKDAARFNAAAVSRLRGTASPVVFDAAPVAAGATLLARPDLLRLAGLADKLKAFPICTTQIAPGLLLRFQEYDRTNAEKLGGAYTGTGDREDLGLAATDEQGNYIFRFGRSLADDAIEAGDVGAGETIATQIFPDVIVQALGNDMTVEFETAPHYNIPNLVRIDLCIPQGSVHPSTGDCSGFDRVITKIGDVIVLHAALGGHPNTLTPDGRITSRNVNGPQVDCAAWRNLPFGGRVGLSLYGCLGPGVAHYTVRFRRHSIPGDDQFVIEPLQLVHVPELGPLGYTGTPVGPFLRNVNVDGNGVVSRPAYDNHDGDSNWIENDLKLILDTARYCDSTNRGTVDFVIQGYNAAGNPVADDIITLFLDNNPTTGSIKNINVSAGAPAPDDCALLTLGAADAPLTVQYTVDNPDGFLNAWGLSVTRGNNFALPVTASGVVPRSFATNGLADPCQFHGSADYALDADGFTETILQPAPHVDPDGITRTSWLPGGKNFCAFAFTLTATDRVTDGRNAYPQTVFWQDLVGLNFG